MKYIDAEKLKAEIEKLKVVLSNPLMRIPGPDYVAGGKKIAKEILAIVDSLQQEPIEKDEETEKLIVCDIIEATIARINGGKKDEEKEENIMREKIAYLRDLGLKRK